MIDDALPRESGAARPPNPKFPCALLPCSSSSSRPKCLSLSSSARPGKGAGENKEGPHRQEMYSGVATHLNVSETCQSKVSACPSVAFAIGQRKTEG